jgi:predicted nucleic acid-binding protein
VSAVVVDTDVVSFLFKRDTRAAAYQPHLAFNTPYVSFMTLAELDYWALSGRWGPARVARLERFVTPRFAVVPHDRAICRLWAEVTNICRRAGHPIKVADAWVAATALHLGVPLLTHNRSDYAAVPGLTVISGAP